jgi:hypothetical protein
MRTTLAFPDSLVLAAKQQALIEGTTLTELLTQGLELRLKKADEAVGIPVSQAGGGLVAGVDWIRLRAEDRDGDNHR